jgi:hypothetical protein
LKSLLVIPLLLILSSCSTTANLPPPEPVTVTVTEQVKPPKPIVPAPNTLNMRPVKFVIITKDNFEEQMKKLSGAKAIIGLDETGYKNLSLNMGELRALIEQQNKIIAIYEKQWD